MNRNASRSLIVLGVLTVLIVGAVAAHAECTPTELAEARKAYDNAYAFVQQGKWQTSVRQLVKAVEACPEHWESQELLGQAYLRTKKYDEAVEQYEILIEGKFAGDVTAAEARMLQGYGFALLKAEEVETAEDVYLALHAKDEENTETMQRLVYVYEVMKDYENAVRFEKLLFTSDPENMEYAKKIGDLYKKDGNIDEAQRWYDMAAAGGVATTGSFDIGREQMKAKNYAVAAESFRDYLENKPDSAAAWQNLGFCLDKMADKKGAIDAFEKAVALAPDKHSVASSLGFLYLDAGNIPRAEALAQDAISNWPPEDAKLKTMYYLMGKVREAQERYREAITNFDAAIGDPYWGEYAASQIERQRQLMAREEALQKKAEQGS